MSEWTIEGDETMRWDVIAAAPSEQMMPAAVYSPAESWPEIKDVPEGNVRCDGCRGDGVYYGRGSVVNGHFVGFTGTCFRCGGKGSQTKSDVARNRVYDSNRIVRI